MAVQIKWRRDTAANWTANNPVLAQGEPGFETNTGAYKIGNGSTAWNSLAYGTFSSENIAALFEDQLSGSDPSAPATGKLTVYGKLIANRMMLKQLGPAGTASAIQPFLGRNKVAYFMPQGSSSAVPGIFGYTSPTTIGTANSTAVTTTNFFTRMRRINYVSTATINTYGGNRVAVNQIYLDMGFYKIVRFGISDLTLASSANMFVGVSATNAAPTTGAEPSTLVNLIGVGHGAADTNLKIFYGGTTAQPPIDLGANFPINTTSTDVYELALFAPPGADYNIYYEVTRVNTGNVATGVITGDSDGIALPAPLLLLTYAWHWRCNVSGSNAVGLDIMSDYIETDY